MSQSSKNDLALVYAVAGNMSAGSGIPIDGGKNFSMNALEAFKNHGTAADSRDVEVEDGKPVSWDKLVDPSWKDHIISAELYFEDGVEEDRKEIEGALKPLRFDYILENRFSKSGIQDFDISEDLAEEAIEEFEQANLEYERRKYETVAENYSEMLEPDTEPQLSSEIDPLLDKSGSENFGDLITELGDEAEIETSDSLNVDLAVNFLEMEYSRDSFRDKSERETFSSGNLAGLNEYLIADKTSSIWRDRWGNVMAYNDEKDEQFKLADSESEIAENYETVQEKVERLRDEELPEDYDSRLDYMVSETRNSFDSDNHLRAALVKAAADQRLDTEMENYLFEDYLPDSLQEIGDLEEMREANDLLYRHLFHDMKSEIETSEEIQNNAKAGRVRDHVEPQLDQEDYERAESSRNQDKVSDSSRLPVIGTVSSYLP